MTAVAHRPAPTDAGSAAEESAPEWLSCRRCRTLIYIKRFNRLFGVCPDCDWHSPLSAIDRIAQIADRPEPIAVGPTVDDPLSFVDTVAYADRLGHARRGTGLDDVVRVARGRVRGNAVVVAAMDFRFMGGSMGVAAGEAITTAGEHALAEGLPLLLVTASGGARMQEGALSLMQMAKTSNAMAELDEAGLLTMTLVTDPTYGGVAASFATLSDVVVAEPGARMGFAGPRVIEQTIGEQLPKRFQTAEFLLKHGLIDRVCGRSEIVPTVGTLIAATVPGEPDWGAGVTDPAWRDPETLPQRSAVEVVKLSRHLGRHTTLDHLNEWTDSFLELHGDRTGEDNAAIVGGVALFDGLPVMVIGHQKGHTTAELVRRSFGMPSPAGYRKAQRLMRLAGKLRLPVLTLIDTPGAHPGLSAEERGQAAAIADCQRIMGGLPVPVVAVVTGEGGSGGALALGVADRVLISQNASYSVISPEGCAAILWKTPEAAPVAAQALGLDARSLLRLGVVDAVVPEPDGGAHRDPVAASRTLRDAVICALRDLRSMPGNEIVRSRRARFRRFGVLPQREESAV